MPGGIRGEEVSAWGAKGGSGQRAQDLRDAGPSRPTPSGKVVVVSVGGDTLCPFAILSSKPVLFRSPSCQCLLPTSTGGGTALHCFALINLFIKHLLTASCKTLG